MRGLDLLEKLSQIDDDLLMRGLPPAMVAELGGAATPPSCAHTTPRRRLLGERGSVALVSAAVLAGVMAISLLLFAALVGSWGGTSWIAPWSRPSESDSVEEATSWSETEPETEQETEGETYVVWDLTDLDNRNRPSWRIDEVLNRNYKVMGERLEIVTFSDSDRPYLLRMKTFRYENTSVPGYGLYLELVDMETETVLDYRVQKTGNVGYRVDQVVVRTNCPFTGKLDQVRISFGAFN